LHLFYRPVMPMFDLTACHVERTAEQDYRVSWRTHSPGQEITIYMTDDPERYYSDNDPGTPVLSTTAEEALISNPDKDVRHYFCLRSAHGETAILAERKLSLHGTPNFRDLGGYQSRDGRRLKWGKLYRSGKLSNLSDVDRQYIRRLGVTLVCDFRQVVEQELEPTWLGEETPNLLASLPTAPGSSANFIDNLHNGIIAVEDAAGFMEEMNRDFVANQLPQYAEMFQLLLAGDQQLLIHCASGKDRTGFGAALILDVLDVEESSIVSDYLLTNTYLPVEQELQRLSGEFTDKTGAAVPEKVLRPLLEVKPEYIKACFEEIRKRYESREHFFETALSLDERKIEQLKDRYLH
jgi:protein-tyrosine phosphatase